MRDQGRLQAPRQPYDGQPSRFEHRTMASLDENAPPAATMPPAPPAPMAPSALDGERDILDDQLDLLTGSMVGAGELDATAVELAGLLVEKGDDASSLRAHRVLAECGVQLGCWGLGERPKLKNAADLDKPMGAFVLKPSARSKLLDDSVAVPKTRPEPRASSTTSLRGAPPIADDLDPVAPPAASEPRSLADFLKP